MIILPEQMRRINDMGAYMEQRIPTLPDYHVLLINKDHSLIKALEKIKNKKLILNGDKPEENLLTQKITNNIYNMAKLSVGGLNPEQVANLQLENASLISELLNSN